MADFYASMLPYAQRASKALNIPTSVILAQWAVESAKGTSNLSKSNNFAGISYVNYADYKAGNRPAAEGGSYSGFNSIDNFVNAYIRVMSLPYYDKVRAADTVSNTIRELGLSPYAATHYGGQGQSVLSVYNQDGLGRYDLAPSGVVTIPQLTMPMPDVSKMSQSDVTKYAAIGAAVVAVIALIPNKQG